MNNNSKIINPHDKFFKEIFSKEKDAREFLSTYLPDNIKRIIDLSRLSIFKDSFIEKELHEYFSDILYQVEIKGQPAWIYLLFEHKSYPDTLIAYKLLRYMVKIWELLLSSQEIHKRFPLIIPLVIYHGRSPWEIGRKFSDLFSLPGPSLSSYIPDFSYLLYDLSTLTDEQIKGGVTLKVFLLLLKYIFHDDLKEHLSDILGLMKDMAAKTTGMEYLETFLRYIVNATDTINEKDLKDIITKIFPKGGEAIMPTIADKWIQQGVEKGRQEGILQGLLEAIELGLKLKFGTKGLELYPTISKIKDTDTLRSIKDAIEIAQEIEEIKRFIRP